jgi:hypothetical protein
MCTFSKATGSTRSFNTGDLDGFLHTASLLQSATKYRINWLRNEVITHLSRSWPHTLQLWLLLDHTQWRPHPALVINLARKCNAHILLPTALYCLARLSMAEAFDVQLRSSKGPIAQSAYRLSSQDVFNYIRYQERRSNVALSFIKEFLEQFQPDSTCHNADSGSCKETPRGVAIRVRDPSAVLKWTPLRLISAAMQYADAQDKPLCHVCRQRFSAAVDEKKQAVWEELPGWFSLQSWNSLRAGFDRDA